MKIRTITATALATAFAFTASANAQNAVHTDKDNSEIIEEIAFVTSAAQSKVFAIVMKKAETQISFKLAALEDNDTLAPLLVSSRITATE